MFNVLLKNKKQFSCEQSDTLLVGAAKENIVLNYSCKTGRCQSCKAKLLDGSTECIHDEIGLSEVEKANGYILTCVRTPASDLVLDIEDLSEYKLAPVKTIPSKIDKLIQLTEDIIEVHLRIPPTITLDYLPGQYVNFIKEDFKRSYSIANHKASPNLVFFIKNYEGGRFSRYLFNEAKVNDLIRLEVPLGTFFYRETEKKNIVFLATGTGIAPIKAIIEKMEENASDYFDKQIYICFGGRRLEDLFWKPAFGQLSINFIPVLSRSDENWKGSKGYVQDVLLSYSIDLTDAVVYACGSEKMINDSKEILTKSGLSEEFYYSDIFVSTN